MGVPETFDACGGQAPCGALTLAPVVEGHGGHQERAVARHVGSTLLVEVGAVLDAVDSGFEAASDSLQRHSVRGHSQVHVMCFVDDGSEFGDAVVGPVRLFSF